MPQTIDLKAKGLHDYPNPLSLPPGAMLLADNVVIDRDDTTDQRRGYGRYGTALVGTIKKLFSFMGRFIVHHGTTLSYDSDGLGTWVAVSGSYSPPTGAPKIRSTTANKNFYFTTDAGVKKKDTLTGTPTQAGGLKGLDGSGALSGASGFMANNSQVAYRIVFGIKDANDNKILGAPSSRIIVPNSSGGTRDVAITFTLSSSITTSHFYQIYRSAQTASSTDEPNDELQLVVEKSPTAPQVTALEVVYTDAAPDSLRGATIYTSPSQQGISQSNEPPPLCRDMATFKNMTMYAYTVSKQRLNITMISVGGTGIVNNDTITLGGVVYTGKAAETAATGEFLVSTGGTPAQNIDTTARSLVRVVNKYASNTTVYAYYLTGYADLPGQILIEERGLGASTFVAISSRGSAFSPPLPSSASAYISSNDTRKNGVYVSKVGQPEAVPIGQVIPVGDANNDILRIVALRDAVFIEKTDGIFRITGEDPTTLRSAPFDNTTIIKGIESATAFNNQVGSFSTQGVAMVSESGAAIVSRQIEGDLLELSSDLYVNFSAATFGVAYESDRKFLLFTVTETTDTFATQAYVYNAITNTWTRWYLTRPDMVTVLTLACGLVNPADNRLYLGSADATVPYVLQERKSFTHLDYADDDFDVQVTGQNGRVLTLVSTSAILAGYTIAQGSNQKASKVVSVDSSTQITVTDLFTWDFASAVVYKPIRCDVAWAPQHGGNPGIMKHFTDLLMLFRNASFDSLELTFTTDISGFDETTTVLPNFSGLWGLFPWGFPSWGGRDVFLQTIRTFAPINKARGRWLNISVGFAQALTTFSITGQTIFYTPMSQRSR